MRLTIRDQILIPLIAIQGLSVCAITAATATLAARRGERQIIDRLNGVVSVLGRSNFPYTGGVLARMRGLSGAEFVAYGADGRVEATSLAEPATAPSASPAGPPARLDSLGQAPVVRVAGVRHFAVPVGPNPGVRGATLLVLYPEASWRQARLEAATPPLWLGGASLVVMAAVTGWTAHRLGRRIGGVGREVARIAAGDFQPPDPGAGADEINELLRSIGSMCEQLRAMSGVVQKTERTRLLAQLAAGLAHQLRNALTGARMSVQLHARRCAAAAGDRSLDVALRQLAMTEEQVKGLLSLGRVEDRPPSVCPLGPLLGEIALLVGPACEHAGVGLDVHEIDGSLAVVAEESALRAAVLNLTLNAVEAAGRGGSVRLEAVAEGGGARIDVTDTGPGPPPGLGGSVFEPFVTGKAEGVGLGLALAHEVASRHGGELRWERVGELTRFRLSLPRPADDARRIDVSENESRGHAVR